MSMAGKFYIRPAAGELIRVEYVPEQDDRAILAGRLRDGKGNPVPDAAVLLFRDEAEEPVLMGRTVTDEDGQFLFGPLDCTALYAVKVFKNGLQERFLDLRSV